ncbi:MAG TPA: M20/M25/M40 family metallo-hydrolase, partial [Symbiobacteriaceae bacterium]|nr:M20/M25/M40 family metallo-hydrolase [Symbiobacteriaceae bacterium]
MYAAKAANNLSFIRTSSRQRWSAGLAAILFLAALYGVAVLQWTMPAAKGESAPAAEFSAVRALKHVEAIAKEPHPTGTPAHAAVREYILGQFRALGLEPQVQEAVVALDEPATTVAFMTVRNVMARMKGTETGGKALVLAAHYDSVPTGPGANDDGTGVAAVLEAARALKAGPPLKRDVIFLITDGEEAGLLGARAFVKHHPLAQDAGLFLNFEMRGTDGPVFMFRVSEGNAGLMQDFAEAVPYPLATSLADSIFKLMPNDTDVTAFRTLPGVAYFDVAGIGNGRLYHSMLDDAAHVNPRVVQHMGSYAMGVARWFTDGALPPARTEEAVWFDAFRWWLVQYPVSWALPLALVAALLTLLVLVQASRWKVVSLKELGVSLLALPVGLGLMFGIIWAFMNWGLTRMVPWIDLLKPAYVALACALMLGAVALWRRWAGTGALMAAGLLWWAILDVAMAVLMPGGSYLLLWPLVFALLGFEYLLLVGEERVETVRGLAVLTLCLVPAFLLVISMAGPFYDAVLFFPQAPTALIMLVLALCPVYIRAVLRSFRWWAPAVAFALSIGLAVGALVLPPTDTHPGMDNLAYGLDVQTGKAYWLSGTSPQDDYTKRFVGTEEWQDSRPTFFPAGGYFYAAPTAVAPGLVASTATVVSDAEAGGERVLRIRVASAREGGLLGLYMAQGVQVKEARILGQALAPKDKPWSMVFVAPPRDGVEVEFRVPAKAAVKFRLIDGTFGLPAGT